MTYIEFITKKPILYGSTIDKNLKQHIGRYEPRYNKYSNTLCYFLIGKNGRKTSHGFTLNKAFSLMTKNKLSADPEKGKPENYV